MVTNRRMKTKRCGTCQGCRADFCGTCLYCANHRPESRTLCVVRRCKNKIVTERQSKTNFKQKVKTVRCGKCTGCRAESCGQCLRCLTVNPSSKLLCLQRRCSNTVAKETLPSSLSIDLQ